MVHSWASINPSTSIEWTPCFTNFTCAKLQVPLDYGDPSQGQTAIAWMKYAAPNATEDTPNVVINPGGPGGSGVQAIAAYGPGLSQVLLSQYNIVGFDPRGVGESGPVVDCWPNDVAKRAQFEKLFYPETSNASSTSLDTQYYTAEIFGKACTETVGGSNGSAAFISTPAVAHDIFTYITAEQVASNKPKHEAKLFYYGVSYGTALGATFAHLYPDHVERMVLDGVIDAADYYALGWKSNLYDTDAVLDSFFKTCHLGGPKNCSFWGPSVKNIHNRMNNILAELKYHPIPVPTSEACNIPLMATYSGLKEFALMATYTPHVQFPQLADVLTELETGNVSAYMSAITSGSLPANACNNGSVSTTEDVNTLIKCVDGYSGHRFQDISQFRDYYNLLTFQSSFFGEVWPNNANGVSCRSFHVSPPKSGRLHAGQESILEKRKISFPILFVTAELDPVAPKQGAYLMSSAFPGSVVLTQNSTGHTALASASECLLENIQSYFIKGELPATNTTCQEDVLPFQGQTVFSLVN
ncbi:hypothetical protein N7510_004614 [Penicillium lagena]|uniref:uncharacterized protein n=1 Tax=Penicillium lagena TaxID=94218 RepID=UPI002540B2E5|nr:uncharacterized protein N7510_004614 [Penicillium lagena]KAJ5620630.1 hypothetical protein N7510_004614 [Penicillium lagena]